MEETSTINIYDKTALIQLSLSPEPTHLNLNFEEKLKEVELFFKHQISLNVTPLRAVMFEDQYIDSRWGFVFNKDNEYIEQSAYLKPESLINSILEKKVQKTISLNNDCVYFMAYNHDYANYYHWTIQCLPSLALFLSLKNLYKCIKLLLPSNLPEFALQYIKALQIDIDKEVEFLSLQDNLFFAKKLIYPSVIGGEFSFNTSQSILSFASSYFEKSLKNGSSSFNIFSKERYKILYCSRLDSQNRKIVNEGTLVDMLKNKFGAKIFMNTGQSVKEQARRFYEADIIISPHGAGLSNVIYCQPHATVIEFMPDKYINPCFATLAFNKGCSYFPYMFPTKIFDGHQHDYEWEVDIDAIETILTKIV